MILQVLYILCCVYVLQAWRRKRKEPSAIPELSGGLPVIGHAWKMMGDRKHAFNLMKESSKQCLEKGGILLLKLGPRSFYILSDPDECLHVSNQCLDKHHIYSFGKPFLGNGLTVADVPVWKQHRKWVMPAFRQHHLNGFLNAFNQHGRRASSQFRTYLGKGPFNHETVLRLTNLESVCYTSFGANVTEFSGNHQDVLIGSDKIMDIATERLQKVWLHSDMVFNWSNLKKRQDTYIAMTKKFSIDMLTKRKAEMDNEEKNSNKSGDFASFLSYFLKSSKETACCSEEDILDECQNIVTAGYDTSSSISTLALTLLGSHPEIQEKVFQELQEVFGHSDRDVTKEDLIKLCYLEAVIKETLRLYPAVPIIARHVQNDLRLKNYTLKAGNGVIMSIWAVHRHAAWGADAEQFRPERWLDGSLPAQAHAFGVFSFGKRACIGKTYAMMSLKIVLSHVLRYYKINSDISKLELEIHTTLRPTCGHDISIEKRKHKKN